MNVNLRARTLGHTEAFPFMRFGSFILRMRATLYGANLHSQLCAEKNINEKAKTTVGILQQHQEQNETSHQRRMLELIALRKQ